jgi:hypothetical protein
MPNSKEPLALTAVGGSTPTLAKFDPKSDKARWNFSLSGVRRITHSTPSFLPRATQAFRCAGIPIA